MAGRPEEWYGHGRTHPTLPAIRRFLTLLATAYSPNRYRGQLVILSKVMHGDHCDLLAMSHGVGCVHSAGSYPNRGELPHIAMWRARPPTSPKTLADARKGVQKDRAATATIPFCTISDSPISTGYTDVLAWNHISYHTPLQASLYGKALLLSCLATVYWVGEDSLRVHRRFVPLGRAVGGRIDDGPCLARSRPAENRPAPYGGAPGLTESMHCTTNRPVLPIAV